MHKSANIIAIMTGKRRSASFCFFCFSLCALRLGVDGFIGEQQ
ncbi:MAG TPA: hypothetical protein VHB46_05265 [Burkholderiales bacterium]|nr:hypothetical protein [Burkholderiales bacterium]